MKEFQKICHPTEIKPSQIKSVRTVDSLNCFNALKTDKKSHLIDVRTKSEWEFVGVPDLSIIGKNIFCISWRNYPSMTINSFFEKEIINFGLKKDDHLYFLCRSGQRSLQAAEYVVSKGYSHCFNVVDGFEGEKNSKNHRSKINGWKFSQLPWRQ